MTDETLNQATNSEKSEPSETPTPVEPVTPRKWAGKFDSPEALEEAYKNTAKVYQENQEIKEKYQSLIKVPDTYSLPEDLILNAREREIIERAAKGAGLNQDHYVKIVQEFHADELAKKKALEERRKVVGEEKINVLHDYVQKFIPEKIREVVFNKLLEDDAAMSDAMNDRDKRLNSQAPGMNGASTSRPSRYDGEKELIAAREEYRKYPNEKNRKRYIDMASEVGANRFPGKS